MKRLSIVIYFSMIALFVAYITLCFIFPRSLHPDHHHDLFYNIATEGLFFAITLLVVEYRLIRNPTRRLFREKLHTFMKNIHQIIVLFSFGTNIYFKSGMLPRFQVQMNDALDIPRNEFITLKGRHTEIVTEHIKKYHHKTRVHKHWRRSIQGVLEEILQKTCSGESFREYLKEQLQIWAYVTINLRSRGPCRLLRTCREKFLENVSIYQQDLLTMIIQYEDKSLFQFRPLLEVLESDELLEFYTVILKVADKNTYEEIVAEFEKVDWREHFGIYRKLIETACEFCKVLD